MAEDPMSVAYKGMVVKDTKEVFKPNPKSLDGVPDLCMLTYLGEENVLHNLDCRYKKQECYTSTTAKVLVAVNPYERMDALYTEEVMTKYQNAAMNLEGLATAGDLPPHVFTVANAAYNNLLAYKKNQSIIVCGESGSGKTESAKYMMRFLAFTTTSTSLDPKEFAEAEAIGTQILDANPILESFGNAKTLLNNNSSRFGKFTKMLFEEAKTAPGKKQRRKLVGALIETYLLEKSRVVRQDKGERNFHVFYQLTAVHADYPALKLGPADSFHYVNQSGVNTLDDLRFPGKGADVEWHKELIQALNTLLVPKDQQTAIFKCVAGVLHLGNINFTQLKGEGSDISNPEALELSAEMFEVDVKGFTGRLQTRSVPLPGGKTIIKPLNEPDAIFNRDSVARNLYNGLFRWIVWRINQQSNAQEGPAISWIGILDVFGFEIFENNSFEQFCINFANERLQQYFNEHVLKAEQDLYKKEALLWDPIDLPDNQDCIDLVMSKPYGILPILDSTCVQPKGTDEVFTANLFKAHKYHPRLRQMKQRKKEESDKQYETFNGFVVRHYAGAVIYDCANFLIKNADASEFDTLELFLTSKSDIASKILRMKADGSLEDTKRGFQRAFRSTGTVFSDQLSELMVTLRKTAPYFVRCIKPNNRKKPREFIGDYVRPQLRCGGLIEALKIIKLGFPTRCAYTRVHEIFHSLLKDKPVTNLNVRDYTEGIMKYLGSKTEVVAKSDYQLGLTMVFFRPGRQTFLTDILDKKPEEVSKEDRAAIRKWLVKKRWVRGRGTVKAWLRCAKMVCEMRFKKAAISMVLIYRTLGRALKSARAVLGGKKEEEESARRMKDAQFQAALAAQQKLKALEEQKAKMDAEWAKKEAETKRTLEERDAEIAEHQHKAAELNSQLKELKAQLAESDSKRLQLHNSSKTQIMELQNKLMEEKNIAAQLKREQANDKQTIQDFEDQVRKNQTALEDLRRSLGLGKQEYETQLSDKDRLIAELRERIARLEQQLADLKEQSERTIRDLTEQLEQSRNESRENKNTLENSVREKEAALARLQSEHAILQETSDSNSRSQTDAHDATKEELRLLREKLTKNLEQKESELNEAKRELALLAGKLEASQASQAESAKQLENATREHSEREAEAKDRNDKQLKKLEAKATELQSALAIATDRLETLKKEQDGFKTASDEAKGSLTRSLKDKEAEVAELKNELQRTQAKLDALQTQFTERTAALQEELNRARNDARDIQNKCDKELWEKNSDLSAAKSELALVKDKLTADKERAENALASTQSALDQEKKINAERQNKLTVELSAKSSDLKDMKAEFRNEKNEWRLKQEKYEKQVAQLESDLDTAQDELNMRKAKGAMADKEGKDASHESDSQLARKEAKWQAQVDDLRADLKEVEDQMSKLRSEKNKALSDLENERDAWRDAEAKYKEDLTRSLSDLDKAEKNLIDFRHQQAEEMEHKMQALQGQVSLLRNLTDDLKSDKSEAKDREASLSEQLKEAVAALAQTRSELKHLQASVNTERDKLRAEIDGVRESHSSEREKWKGELAAHEKKLGEKSTQLTEMKAELHHLQEKEGKAQAALKDNDGETKEELHRLKLKNEELSAEQKAFLEKNNSYEQRLGKVTKELLEAQAALSEVEHKRRADGSRTEVEVLKAKLTATEKQIVDKNKSIDKQIQLVKDDWKREIEELKKQHDKELKNQETDQKSQNEAYKYKLQYLELSGGELQKERKRWQDKEREYEKALVSLTAELRELKYEHQQAVDLHEAFRAHVDAKDSARQMESSNFDIKRQAIQAEHHLSLRQSETSLKARISQLERENGKLKGELDDAQEEIERLTVTLESGEERVSRPEERVSRPERSEYTSSRKEPAAAAAPAPVAERVAEPTTQVAETQAAPEPQTTATTETTEDNQY